MAELQVEGDELWLRLSTVEKVEGVHGDLHAPVASLQRVEVLDDAHGAAGFDAAGFKVGTRIPGVVDVGRMQNRTSHFVAVHCGTPRGVRLVFRDAAFDEWIVGCADPELKQSPPACRRRTERP